MSIQTRNTRGWHKANTKGDVTIWGLGKKMNWGRMKTDIKYFKAGADGSGVLTGADGTSLAIDFSRASGADAMLAMAGPGAPGDERISVGERRLSFKFLTTGEEPTPKVEGGKVVIDKETVSMKNGYIVLGRMRDS